MWRWRRRRRARTTPDDDPNYVAARKRIEDLERRANRVVPELHARRNRNHWGETIAAIARTRKEHPS